eukprot:Skav205797  [mRNA]  locus=scaffold307:90025:94324:+ [translate_table: standard]
MSSLRADVASGNFTINSLPVDVLKGWRRCKDRSFCEALIAPASCHKGKGTIVLSKSCIFSTNSSSTAWSEPSSSSSNMIPSCFSISRRGRVRICHNDMSK